MKKAIELYDWRVTNKEFDVFLKVEENDLVDCRIKGKVYGSVTIWKYTFAPSYNFESGMIIRSWKRLYKGEYRYYVETSDGCIIRLVEPNADYIKATHTNTKKLVECVQAKSKM